MPRASLHRLPLGCASELGERLRLLVRVQKRRGDKVALNLAQVTVTVARHRLTLDELPRDLFRTEEGVGEGVAKLVDRGGGLGRERRRGRKGTRGGWWMREQQVDGWEERDR